ncbi:MAG: VOC family protein [Bacteroidota bacterium]
MSTPTPPRLRLDHASIMTASLQDAIHFYVDVLGLTLRCVEEDPLRQGHQRALLTDADGCDVLEIIEMTELAHPTVPGRGGLHHLGFRLAERDWYSLRTRLDAQAYPYHEVDGRLFVRDADGLVLELEYA